MNKYLDKVAAGNEDYISMFEEYPETRYQNPISRMTLGALGGASTGAALGIGAGLFSPIALHKGTKPGAIALGALIGAKLGLSDSYKHNEDAKRSLRRRILEKSAELPTALEPTLDAKYINYGPVGMGMGGAASGALSGLVVGEALEGLIREQAREATPRYGKHAFGVVGKGGKITSVEKVLPEKEFQKLINKKTRGKVRNLIIGGAAIGALAGALDAHTKEKYRDVAREATDNPYLDKVAQMTASGSSSSTSSSGSKSGKFSAPKMNNTTNKYLKRGVSTLKMGPHTTPEDLLPNPSKMDIKVK